MRQQAQEYVSKGNYEQAYKAYESLTQQCPDEATLHYSKGRMLVKLNRLYEALAAFSEAISKDRTRPNFYYDSGMVLLDLKDYEKALTDFTEAIKLDPEMALAYFRQGQSFLALQRYAEAQASFAQALQFGYKNSDVYVAHGTALAALQRYNEAVNSFDQALQGAPERLNVYIDKAQALVQLERLGEALTTVEQGLQREPQHVALLRTRDLLLKKFQQQHSTDTPALAPTTAQKQTSNTPQSNSSPSDAKKRNYTVRSLEEKAPTTWKVGDIILNDIEVQGVLGEGGMGIVYKVFYRPWNREMAVKSPRPEIFTKAHGKEDFIREAETWLRLEEHPHIVTCYLVRKMGAIPRIFIEYVDGGSLANAIKKRTLYAGGPEQALERVLDVAIQFAWGLHAAHEHGLVHQDIKPLNVMLTQQWEVKVTDFGLAKARALAGEEPRPDGEDQQSILVSGGGMTPAYCSPEQASGQPLSRKTDIWSWAVSVLEMFTGGVTWKLGPTARQALSRLERQDTAIPAIPPDVVKLLARCLRQRPEERPVSMQEIATELQAIYARMVGRPYPRTIRKKEKPQVNRLCDRASSLAALGQYEEALTLYEEAIRLDPTDLVAYPNKGIVLAKLGRDEEALAAFNEALRRDPMALSTHENKALFLFERGRFEEAQDAYAQLIRLKPTEASFYYARGSALFQLKRYEEALAAFDSGIRLNPAAATSYAHYSKGKILFKLRRLPDALASYDTAMHLDPTDAAIHNSKGEILLHLNRPAEALAAYEETLRLNPQLASAHHDKGVALNDLKRYAEALAAFEECIRLDPADAAAYYSKGLALSGLGRYEEASAAYDEAIRRAPTLTAAVFYNKGGNFFKQGRYEEALATYEKALHLNPAFALPVYEGKASVLRAMGRTAEAEQAAQKAQKLRQQA